MWRFIDNPLPVGLNLVIIRYKMYGFLHKCMYECMHVQVPVKERADACTDACTDVLKTRLHNIYDLQTLLQCILVSLKIFWTTHIHS